MKSELLNQSIPPLTVYKEMRGETYKAKMWVAWVIMNRSLDRGSQWKDEPWEVCLEKGQFVAWAPTDVNAQAWPSYVDARAWRNSVTAWLTVSALVDYGARDQSGVIEGDSTRGANHYHSYTDPFDVRIRMAWKRVGTERLTEEELKQAYQGSVGTAIHVFKF